MGIQLFVSSKVLLALFAFSLLGAFVTFILAMETTGQSQLKLQDFIFVTFCGVGTLSLYLIFALDVIRDKSKGYIRKTVSMIAPTAGIIFAAFVLVRILGN